MRRVAVVSLAQLPSVRRDDERDEAELVQPVVAEALGHVGLSRKRVGFTVSGSCDYLLGRPFSFVSALDGAGPWPPISESHVEMDGAWALYEAWVRLQHGDVDVALVFASGRASLGASLRETLTFQLDPYYLAPIGADYVSLAALQGQAVLARDARSEKDLAEIVAQRHKDAAGNPNAAISGSTTADKLLAADYVVAPLRAHDIGPPVDGAAAVVLVAGDRAREVCDRPAWITGIDHRVDPHYSGVRDLASSPSATLAGERAGVTNGGVEVAELSAVCTPEELVLAEAFGLGDDVVVNPSGGALVANPVMVTGLVRIGEAFRQVHDHGKQRVLGHASSGPCLQQNLVCVLEGSN